MQTPLTPRGEWGFSVAAQCSIQAGSHCSLQSGSSAEKITGVIRDNSYSELRYAYLKKPGHLLTLTLKQVLSTTCKKKNT